MRANTVGVFHLVAEGIADALAINAREDGAALAVGGTSGFGRLARLIVEAADVSDLLGYSPSDEAPTSVGDQAQSSDVGSSSFASAGAFLMGADGCQEVRSCTTSS